MDSVANYSSPVLTANEQKVETYTTHPVRQPEQDASNLSNTTTQSANWINNHLIVRSTGFKTLSGMRHSGRFQDVLDVLCLERLPHAAFSKMLRHDEDGFAHHSTPVLVSIEAFSHDYYS
jgi:hypothetical protein